jgi:hypothetical protein
MGALFCNNAEKRERKNKISSHVFCEDKLPSFSEKFHKCIYLLTPLSRALEKLIVTQLVKKFPVFEPKDSLLCSQQPTTGPYSEPHVSSPHL